MSLVSRQYHCLVAGLREFTAQGDHKGFDIRELRAEIIDGVRPRDSRSVGLLYAAYDIENIIAARRGSERYSPLGSVPRDELNDPKGLPRRLERVVNGYREDSDDEDFDRTERFERALWDAWYEECKHSCVQFLRRWAEADRVIRSVIAGERLSDDEMEYDPDAVDEQLPERVRAILAEPNLVEREQRLDMLRWELADEFSERHYSDINFLLGYLAKANIIEHQMAQDAQQGRELLERLVEKLRG